MRKLQSRPVLPRLRCTPYSNIFRVHEQSSFFNSINHCNMSTSPAQTSTKQFSGSEDYFQSPLCADQTLSRLNHTDRYSVSTSQAQARAKSFYGPVCPEFSASTLSCLN